MNNKDIFTPASSKNWIIVFSVLFLLMITSLSINAQIVVKKITFKPDATDDYVIKSFTATEVNNKVYFKFLVLENRYNTNYILESSSNGTDFYAVQLKEGFKSPNETPLLYCYSIDLNNLNDKTYRIRRDSSDGVNYTASLEIENEILPLSVQKD